MAAGAAIEGAPDARDAGRPAVTGVVRSGGISPSRATTIVAVIGLVITLTVSWTAWTLNRHNEHRLLEVQTRQAAAVLSATILSLRNPLETALQIEDATGGSTDQFERFASTYVGTHGAFVSAVLWRSDGSTWRPVATAGTAPLMAQSSPQALAIIHTSLTGTTFAVAPVPAGGPQRIGYAVSDPTASTAIYAERAIPADRVVPVESTSAFSDLDFATYLGPTTSLSALATTDLPLAQLPLTGDVVRTSVPFGDSSVTLVAAPRGPLGGTLGGALPWVFLIGGLLVTVGAAAVTHLLVGRRRRAEQDAGTIADLYQQLDGLYDEQRSIADALQRALLPQRNPAVPNLDVATTYLAGTHGLEIGGDWFSLIELDGSHFAFAVGDVSGKGVGAAAIMARLRFTIRAYLTEGHPPDAVLEMCSQQLNVNRDGHLATALVGVGDSASGVVTLANAGHLDPLLVTGTSTGFVRTAVGLPLGVAPSTYRTTTVPLASGAALVAFTDGLVERRGESIDLGLDRLVGAANGDTGTVDDLLARLTATLGPDGATDDVAVLAFRWTSPEPQPDGGAAAPGRVD
jgi:serine phosphatase RsbU (regulator of sigma subunit)